MCKEGCKCDSPFEVIYESCAGSDTDYLYTEKLCQPVYQISTVEEVEYLNTGVSFLYSPLDTDSFDQPFVLGPTAFDDFCSNIRSRACGSPTADEPYEVGGIHYNNMAPELLSFATSRSYKRRSVSMTNTPFNFYGVDYHQVHLFDDGYLCFGDFAAPMKFKDVLGLNSSQAYDAHFGGGKPCFSFLQTGLGVATGRRSGYSFQQCFKNKQYPGGTWEADTTTYTFEGVPLAGSIYVKERATVTVQVALIFPNQIRVSFKHLSLATTAVIGPSKGAGTPVGFVPPKLPVACERGRGLC